MPCRTDSFNDPTFSATLIQNALRATGVSQLSDVTVTAVDAQNYLINYGNNSGGNAISQLSFSCYNSVGVSTLPGAYLPTATLTPERLPGQTINIFVSAANSTVTAANIQYAFSLTTQQVSSPGVFLPPVADITQTTQYVPYTAPVTSREAMPGVTITARSSSEFDITFTGDGGLNQQPLMSVVDQSGTAISGASVRIIKQSSDAFRVNDPEYVNTLSNRPDVYDQTVPQVAMDADGDFVITWQGAVPDSVNPGSVSDIFARRFSPEGWITGSNPSFEADMNHDGQPDTYIQSVMPLGDQFQVNTLTTNAQTLPSVGMDANGDFTIAWETGGQQLSFFNQIEAQRYDRNGNRLGGEFNVDTTNNNNSYDYQPYVGVGRDGVTVFSWSSTVDPNYFLGNAFIGSISIAVYGANGAVLVPAQNIGGTTDTSICLDANDDFLVSYAHTGIADNAGNTSDNAVFAQEFQIFDPVTHALAFQSLHAEFQISTATLSGSTTLYWPDGAAAGQSGMDADGDLTAAYWSPLGPDISEFTGGLTSQVQDSYNITTIDPNNGSSRKVDVDGYINMWLLYDQQVLGYTDAQLAQDRAEMEGIYPYTPGYTASGAVENVGLLRGANYSVDFSQFNAGITQIIGTNSVANADRGDQTNATYMLAIQDLATAGTIALSVTGPGPTANNITITPVFLTVNGVVVGINAAKTAAAIESAIRGAASLGTDYPHPSSPPVIYQGTVIVRLVPPSEMTQRSGTALDPEPYWVWNGAPEPTANGPNGVPFDVYEITFMGESHDYPVSLTAGTGNWNTMTLAAPAGGGTAPRPPSASRWWKS